MERVKLQKCSSVEDSGVKKQHPSPRAAVWLFRVFAAGTRWETAQPSPTQGSVCRCLGGERLKCGNCTSSVVGTQSVRECLWPWVSVKCFHAGCRALPSLALKVKGFESLQAVPGRDFWLCQHRV